MLTSPRTRIPRTPSRAIARPSSLEPLEPRALLTATLLHSFTGQPTDASSPNSGVILVGNRIYGVSQHGGSHDDNLPPGLGHKGGVLYAVNTDGSNYQILHEFGGTIFTTIADGYEPLANITFFNNKIYGTTPFGAFTGSGTIWSINPDGTGYTLLHIFGSPDVSQPYPTGATPFYAPLVPLNNKLYGIATVGGRPLPQGANGALFSIDPDGQNYTVVRPFEFADNSALFDLGFTTDGSKFYGVTSAGGPANAGTVWSVNVDGSNYQVLHQFNDGTDGGSPVRSIILTSNNTLAGLTARSGANGQGTLYTLNTDGSNFQAPVNFSVFSNGAFPLGDLTEFNGRLYGSTSLGGAGFPTVAGVGSIFSTALDGSDFRTVYTFDGLANNPTDAASPYGKLATDGTNIYGAAGSAAAAGFGAVFSVPLSGGSTPTVPVASVSENGVPVVSGLEVTQFGTVASGATPPTHTFIVTNTGGSTLTLGAVQLPTGFTLTNPLVSSLAPGASDTFTIALDTSSGGTFDGHATFSNNDGDVPNNRFVIPIRGTVTGPPAPRPDLTVTLAGKPPASAIANLTKGKFKLTLRNSGQAAANGATAIRLVLSTDNTADSTDPTITTVNIPRLNLGPGKSQNVTASFTYPNVPANGSYRVLAIADPNSAIAESNESNNTTATNGFNVGASNVNFTPTAKAVTAKRNKAPSLSLTIRNTGNIPAKNINTPIRVILSTDSIFGNAEDQTILTTTQRLSINANKTKTVKLKLPAQSTPGTFSLRAILDPDNTSPDSNPADNTATTTLRVT